MPSLFNPGCNCCGPSTTTPYPGCNCDPWPNTINLTSTGCAAEAELFAQPATIVYGPVPAGYAALSLGPNAWLSTASFTNTATGDVFQYYLSCAGATIALTCIYLTSIFGSPFKDPARYTWLINGSTNACLPFLMTAGVIYSGGSGTCDIAISG